MSYKMSHKQDTLKNTEISIMQTQSQITPKTPQMSLYERNMHELDHKTQDELKTLEIAKNAKIRLILLKWRVRVGQWL